jgi:DNA ligase (NAD+)
MSQLKGCRLNEKFIELMDQLANIMTKQGETFRSRAYQKAQETIMSYPHDIKSSSDLKDAPNIGSTIMEKLNEYVQTGTLMIIEKDKNNPINILSEVYGIGPKKAKELVDNGITNISQLRERQNDVLNDTQKIGLKYYEDILKRIPRSEIEQYKDIFNIVFKSVCVVDSKFEIVGSYRRGAENSGDIDVIITSKDPVVFKKFVDILISKKIIQEVLSRGSTKCLVIAKLPNVASSRRVDFLYTSHEEFPFAILYFTGSKFFNTVMRNQALTMGYTMNEHGIYTLDKDGKTKGDKVSHIFNDEKDIFDFLHLEYKAPNERTDGRSVIVKSRIQSDTDKTDNKSLILEFKKNGIQFLAKLNEKQLTSMLNLANTLYHNSQPIMMDNEFDILQEYITKKYPSNQVVQQIGASVEKNKAILPYHMPSMDKIKPDTNALLNWTKKYNGPYILTCKLDGVSGLYTTEGKEPKLYTRGDGKVGQDISHLIPYLRLPKTKGVVVRGEFIIPKAIFENRYKNKFANPRNMVAGIINNKTVNETMNDIHFVLYEVIQPVLKPFDQLKYLETLNVERVFYRIEMNLTNELLSKTLIDLREKYIYEIDGIIVCHDRIYPRKIGNPEHAFAFKMVLSDQIAEAKVVDIIWSPSKDGYLKPRVQIEPIHLGGVCIEYATGFNGAFINDNKIGVGAVVELIRSGDVIPHIRKVVVQAENPKMPSVPFVWNDSHVDVLLKDIDIDETVKEKNITGFFKGIGVEGLGAGNIARIIQTGFDTIPKIIKMKVEHFLTVEGFKDKTAIKLYNGINEKLASASLITIMSASNLFGRGFNEKKMELIMESYPNVLLTKESNVQKIDKIASIKGIGEKTAELFVERIPDFIKFMYDAGLNDKLLQNSVDEKKMIVNENHPLFGKTIVMTGFRDADMQESLKSVGAKLGASVSKNTFAVLVKDLSEDTGKAVDARKIGIPLMTQDAFKKKYL